MDAGFRVTLKIDKKGEESKTYYIFIDRKDFHTVKDLEDHVKKTFGLTQDVTLLVDDCILPRNEKISVILVKDCIRVQVHQLEKLHTVKDESIKRSEEETIPGIKKVPAQTESKAKTGLARSKMKFLGIYPQDLWNHIKGDLKDTSEAKTPEARVEAGGTASPEPDDSTPDRKPSEETKNGSSKRKRKRKHRSSRLAEKVPDPCSITPPASSLNSSPVFRNSSKENSRKHQYFESDNEAESIGSQGLCIEKEMSSPSKKMVIDLSSENDDTNKIESSDVWQDGLLNMKVTLPEEKVFYRHCSRESPRRASESADIPDEHWPVKISKTFEPSLYPVVDKIKENDVIAFKILKMGEDDCPTVSDYIMAAVKNVDEQSLVTLKLLKGQEEFQNPDVEFMLNCSSYVKTEAVVKLKLNAMIEPRLLYP